ncbi:MAG: oxoacyl-[acyl-carrier protein] reductase [Candidatus Tokpelaia sp. JSC161]|jgi:3-oxoacyl-[acyl-carrier protein] reductase|nr:MAG: oxoacyl-[acyl-carrier protein] reductase [Candidatus Tokpelaia sp. JSC161]
MFKLDGRKALITGATGAIGQEISRAFYKQGAILGLHGTRKEILNDMAEEFGRKVYIFTADFSKRDCVKELAKKADETMGGVDILVNNAGLTRDCLFMRMCDEDWDHVLSVNLTAVFHLVREIAFPMMRRRFGRIINITSVVGITGNAGQTNYCAAKAGLIGFSKALAQESAKRNVTVNCIAPGFIQSPMTDQLNDQVKKEVMRKIPMRSMGVSRDIAAAAVYLASDEASYMTGQTLHINGGMAMI